MIAEQKNSQLKTPAQPRAAGTRLPLSKASSRVSVLTAGRDKPYALGLASALISEGVAFDFVGSNEVDGPDLHGSSLVNFLNLRGDQRADAGMVAKVTRVIAYYVRLIAYATRAEAKIFHILWNNKFEWFDRTLLMMFYRLLGKRIVFTAHNVNAGERDDSDSSFNQLTLGIQYRLCDQIFVHTDRMKTELVSRFHLSAARVTVIPFGINNTVRNSALTTFDARQQLGLSSNNKALLFFGNIAPYKGLEYLVDAFAEAVKTDPNLRLIIAGRPKGQPEYWTQVQQAITRTGAQDRILQRIEYVPDDNTELYFKAADVLILPYIHVFQSGVLFLSYSFGLPVIATDVGSLKEEVIEGQTGFICRPRDAADLADKIVQYFVSKLYRELASRRAEIRAYANDRYSWSKVAAMLAMVYARLQQS